MLTGKIISFYNKYVYFPAFRNYTNYRNPTIWTLVIMSEAKVEDVS